MINRICTTDPINLHDIPDREGLPYVVVGDRNDNLTIYFENEENKQKFLDIPVESPTQEISINLDNPADLWYEHG